MATAMGDMALLRQRVLDSLKRPAQVASDVSDVEEGEIQETVERLIDSKARSFSIVAEANGSGKPAMPFQSGIPGLRAHGVTESGGKVSSLQTTHPPISMPQDLPIEFPLVKPVAGLQLETRTTPWLSQAATRSQPVQAKRAVSEDFTLNTRPVKRFGTIRHPSLVIDLESDDEGTTQLKSSAGNQNSTLNAGAAKLKQVESEIAQAMAVINKAQQMQNSKRSGTPQAESALLTTSAISSVDSSPRPLSSGSKESAALSVGDSLVTKLKILQAQLDTLEESISAKRIDLRGVQEQEVVTASEETIQELTEQNCKEVMRSVEADIARLQKEFTTVQVRLAEIERSKKDIKSRRAASKVTQTTLSAQIATAEQERRIVFEQIASIRTQLVWHTPAGVVRPTTSHQFHPLIESSPKVAPTSAVEIAPSLDGVLQVSANRPHVSSSRVVPPGLESRQTSTKSDCAAVVSMGLDSSILTTDLNVEAHRGERLQERQSQTEKRLAVVPVIPRSDEKQAESQREATAPSTTSSPKPSKIRSPATAAEKTSRASAPTSQVVDKDKSLGSRANLNAVYHSSLSMFVNFKYHAQYLATIQSNKVMCAAETQDQACPLGRNCTQQHFSEIKMTDEEILVELSSRTIGKTNKERVAYREGLRAVLQDMKSHNIDDFEQVCAKMVEYRRTRQEHPDQSISSLF